MRADRLVAILLLLQARGKVTAGEVAEELEISERTARRDLDALGMAGVPVWSQQGRGGGWQLAGGGHLDLSGLTGPEARALLLVAGPQSTATPEVRAALRKLVRALPEPLRDQAEAVATRVVVDPSGWDRTGVPRRAPPHLDAVQRAVIEGEQVVLGYVARDRASTTRVVHPLGLAAKGWVWYLLADTDAGLRTFRVDRVTSVEGTGEAVVRPDGFVLADAWQQFLDEMDQQRALVRASGHAVPWAVAVLRSVLGNRVRIGPSDPDDEGRVAVELRGHSVESLVGEIAGLGHAVRVDGPPEVRARLATVAAELSSLYAGDSASR